MREEREPGRVRPATFIEQPHDKPAAQGPMNAARTASRLHTTRTLTRTQGRSADLYEG